MIYKTEQQLRTFVEEFNLIKVNIFEDYVRYKVREGHSEEWARRANKLIELLELDLVAIPSKGYNRNSFIVKSNETEL